MPSIRVGSAAVCLTAAVLGGCTADDGASAPTPATTRTTTPTASTTPSPEPTNTTEPVETTESTPPPESRPVEFRERAAMRTVAFLAGEVGPREATSAAYRRAARWVEARFEAAGYDVSRQVLRAPAGNSWGVDVLAGRTWNVVAAPPGLDRAEPYRVVGAHLDTVPQAPGAEDNASGISVLLEVARMAAAEPPAIPTVFVAFSAEEPRGEGDDLHHFGSTAMVERLAGPERRALVAMVALDRVGVGSVVPLSNGGLSPDSVRRALARAAEREGVETSVSLNTSSDHWSFEKAGFAVARIGSTPYAAYHSAADVPAVVNPAQLGRVGRVLWAWLTA